MEANRLRGQHAQLAQQYEGEARRTLQRGLKATDNDPQLRGLLGLLEFDAGNPVEARPHLEAVAAAGQAGIHALVALARLRLDEERVKLPADAKLSAAALERVLTPLLAARERRPSVVADYLLIAEAGARSAKPPARDDLAVLLEGAQRFPEDTTLLHMIAGLHARHGCLAETVALVEHEMKRAADPAIREQFTAITTSTPKPHA